jgi:hypothetical protein
MTNITFFLLLTGFLAIFLLAIYLELAPPYKLSIGPKLRELYVSTKNNVCSKYF